MSLEQEFWLHTIEVPAGTRHVRVGLVGYADIAVFDASCEVYDWDCPMIAFGGQWGFDDEVDIPLPGGTRVVVGLVPWWFISETTEYVMSWWVVPDENVNLTVTVPPEVVAGTSVTVAVSWPESLAPGRYLGVLDHANEHTPLRSTLLDVEVPGDPVLFVDKAAPAGGD